MSGQALRVAGGRSYLISWQLPHEGGKVVSPTHWLPLHPKKYLWYLFLLEAQSNPGPQCSGKDYVNEKCQRHHRGTSDLLDCNAVPQPTVPLCAPPHSCDHIKSLIKCYIGNSHPNTDHKCSSRHAYCWKMHSFFNDYLSYVQHTQKYFRFNLHILVKKNFIFYTSTS